MKNHLVKGCNGFLMPMLLLTLLNGCTNAVNSTKEVQDTIHIFPTVSYLDIKLDSNGHLPSNPYTLEFSYDNKKIIFCGTNHLEDPSDTANSMYKEIERKFFSSKPDIAVNEGGDVSKKVYASKQDALLDDGEIGLIKVLSDSAKIKTVNGDPSAAVEFAALLKKYSKGELLAYIVTERLMWGLKGAHITDSNAIKEKYADFLKTYIVSKGKISLTEAEQQFKFYKSNYEALLKRSFSLEELEPTNPFDSTSRFQEIGRFSKEIRDQFLLKTIDDLLDTHSKIFVVFGGWHLLTCEPGLKEIISRKRK